MRRVIPSLIVGSVALSGLWWATVEAQPPAPQAFCEVYPEIPSCSSGEATCATCHTSPPTLNVYGTDLAASLQQGEARPLHEDLFLAGLGEALVAVEPLDSDLDAFTNVEELRAGTNPADASSAPRETRCVDADPSDAWNVCGYDPAFAYKRVLTDFCGRSPTFEERQAFLTAADPIGAIHDQLDVCLDSEFWRGMFGRVWNLANDKISPISAIKAGRRAGPLPLADYDDDYAFWVWANTDDRDVRNLLTGENLVMATRADGLTTYTSRNDGPIEEFTSRGFDVAQLVLNERRAGMMTTRWNLVSNVMFTSVPRNAASAAYRHYLGYDIARLEGLRPVEGEPVDWDNKGVDRPECANCHSTLDPLSYAFTRYQGLGGGNNSFIPLTYDSNRLNGFTYIDGDSVANTPEAGVLFGEPVADLTAWASLAADSEPFRRKLVLDYWTMLVGETPHPEDGLAFTALADGLSQRHGYRVEGMLHELIETEAYGAP